MAKSEIFSLLPVSICSSRVLREGVGAGYAITKRVLPPPLPLHRGGRRKSGEIGEGRKGGKKVERRRRRRRGPVKDIDERKTRIGGEKTEKGWRARRAGSWEPGKKASGRRTGCRRFSKDGTMEAKTETSLTGSRLPTRESTWPQSGGNSSSLGYLVCP